MTIRNTKITESSYEAARDYLQGQLERHSWWPTEQPGLARQEFKLMQGDARALNVWCKKWLDSGQMQQLAKAMHNHD